MNLRVIMKYNLIIYPSEFIDIECIHNVCCLYFKLSIYIRMTYFEWNILFDQHRVKPNWTRAARIIESHAMK